MLIDATLRELNSYGADENYCTFYSHGLDTARLNFELNENGQLAPSYITYTQDEIMSGKKFTVDVLDNGYVIKGSGKSMICSDLYDLKSSMEKLVIRVNEFRMDYDPEIHKFENIDEINDLITNS